MRAERRKIRWGRVAIAVALGGVIPVLCLVLVVFLYGLQFAGAKAGPPEGARLNEFARQAGSWVGPIAGSVVTFLLAVWVARPLDDRFVLHGALVGALVAALDGGILVFVADKFETLFVISNALKVLAGVAGGFSAARSYRQERKAQPHLP